jgi:acetyl-CoA acetyltransferase
VFGHPEGPTYQRSILGLVDTLRLRGGWLGLLTGCLTGCAAGDAGAAVVLEVTN